MATYLSSLPNYHRLQHIQQYLINKVIVKDGSLHILLGWKTMKTHLYVPVSVEEWPMCVPKSWKHTHRAALCIGVCSRSFSGIRTRPVAGATSWLDWTWWDILQSPSRFGRIFRPIMMSSNSFSICSSDSSTGPGGGGSGTDSRARFRFGGRQSLQRGWESEVALGWAGGSGEKSGADWRIGVSGLWTGPVWTGESWWFVRSVCERQRSCMSLSSLVWKDSLHTSATTFLTGISMAVGLLISGEVWEQMMKQSCYPPRQTTGCLTAWQVCQWHFSFFWNFPLYFHFFPTQSEATWPMTVRDIYSISSTWVYICIVMMLFQTFSDYSSLFLSVDWLDFFMKFTLIEATAFVIKLWG